MLLAKASITGSIHLVMGPFLRLLSAWTHFPPSRKYPPILLMAPPLASLSISCDLWALIIIVFEGMKSRIFSFLPPCCCSIINLCPNYWQHLCFTFRKAIDHKKTQFICSFHRMKHFLTSIVLNCQILE